MNCNQAGDLPHPLCSVDFDPPEEAIEEGIREPRASEPQRKRAKEVGEERAGSERWRSRGARD